MQKPIFWLTGLSGAGKTTIANLVREFFTAKGLNVRIIDGDDVRDNRKKRLGFSPEDIEENNRLIANLCSTERNNYDFILVPVISPLEKVRSIVRDILTPEFYLIYCNANLDIVMQRDVKGLYQKAQNGEILNMIGYSEESPYDAPLNADLILNTSGQSGSESETTKVAIEFIQSKLAN